MTRVVFLKSRIGFSGGLEKSTLRLASHFHKRGSEVSILTTFDARAPLPKLEGIELTPLFETKKSTARQLLEFDFAAKERLKSMGADVVFGMERNRLQTHLRAGAGVHRAFLERRAAFEPLYKRVFHKINARDQVILELEKSAFEAQSLKKLFVNSQMVKEEILNHYSTPETKISVVHNGVDLQGTQSSFDSSLEMERTATFKLLFVGNGFERKNLKTVLLALHRIASEDFHLSVVGHDRRINSYRRLVERLSLKKKVSFHGLQSDLSLHYAEADALVLPTFYDPFSGVVLEALAMGLFVITTKTNGASEILNSSLGELVENPLDEEELSASLMRAMSRKKSPEVARMRRSSVEHLDFSQQLDKIVLQTLNQN